jgi:DNA replication protein DnaC
VSYPVSVVKFTNVSLPKARSLPSIKQYKQSNRTQAGILILEIPFPSAYLKVSREGFQLSDSPVLTFDFMGRDSFSSLWDRVEGMDGKNERTLTEVYMQGPVGFGKSHLLAALVVLLSRKEKYVV